MAASNSPSKGRARASPGEGRRAPAGAAGVGQVDEALGDVDTDDLDPPPGQRKGVAARATADVEHPHPGVEAERVDEERDLLARCPW